MQEYIELLEELKIYLRQAQLRATLSVNNHMVITYWGMGKKILLRQAELGWGAKVIDNLSKDLKEAFPKMEGISARNLKYMRKFAETYPDFEIVQAPLAQISWYHHIALMDKLKDNPTNYLHRKS